MVLHLDEKHVAGRVEFDFVRFVAKSPRGKSTVAVVTLLAAAGGCGDRARFQIDAANTMIHGFTDVKRAVRSDDEPERSADPRVDRGTAVAGDRRLPDSADEADFPCVQGEACGEEEDSRQAGA